MTVGEVLEETLQILMTGTFAEETEDVFDTFDSNADVLNMHDAQGGVDTVYIDAASHDDRGIQDIVPTGGCDNETDMRIDSDSDYSPIADSDDNNSDDDRTKLRQPSSLCMCVQT